MASFEPARAIRHSGLGDISFEMRSSLPRTPLSPRPVSSRKTSSSGSHAASSSSHHSSIRSMMASSRLVSTSGVSKSRSDVTLRGDSQSGHIATASDSAESRSIHTGNEKAHDAAGSNLSSQEQSHLPPRVSMSVPASPVSTTSSAFETLGTPASRSITGGYYSSTDGDLETASEGPASIWSRRPSGSAHRRKSSSLGSRVDFVTATFASLTDTNTAVARSRSLSPALSEAREELRDMSSEPSPPTPKGESQTLSHTSAELMSTQDSAPTRSVSPIKDYPGSKDTPKSVMHPIPDEECLLTPSTKATFDTAEDNWSNNFWVVITDPKVSSDETRHHVSFSHAVLNDGVDTWQTGHAFFYNPGTGDCRWVVPAGTIVLPGNPDGDWMEFYDESHGLPYYYHSKSRETRWEKPEGLVIPLTALQAFPSPHRGDRRSLRRSQSQTQRATRTHASDPASRYVQKKRAIPASPRRKTHSTTKLHRERRRDSSLTDTTSQAESMVHGAVDSPYTPLRKAQASDSKRPVTLGRSRLLSDALEEARRAGNASKARSRLVRQRSAFELSHTNREQQKEARARNRAVTATASSNVPSRARAGTSMGSTRSKTVIPRDDSGVVILPEGAIAFRPGSVATASPAKGTLTGPSRAADSDSDYRTPFTSTLNSIREQSASSSSNSIGAKASSVEPGQNRRQSEIPSYAGDVRSVGSLLNIPAPPPSAGARDRIGGLGMRWARGNGGHPPLSPAKSIDMMTLSSYGEPGPIRRPRDPEKRRSKAASPELRFPPPSPEMKSSLTPTQTTGSPSSRKDVALSMHHNAVEHFDHFALKNLAVRKKGLFQKRVDPRDLLRWRANDASPLLPLHKELRADAMCCAKIIWRLCGEREASVFFPKVPPVAIEYTPNEDKTEHRRPLSSSGSSANASYQRPSRHKSRCMLDTQTGMEGEGSTVLEEQRWLLEVCVTKMQLRDEVFCRLITRLEPGAPPTPRFRAWQFLGVLLTTVAPVDAELSQCLEVYAAEVSGSASEHESLRMLARHCTKRLSAIQKLGSRTKAPSLPEIQAAWEAAFHPAVFGQKLDVIMQSQASAYPDTAIPIVLPFLVQTLFALDGTSVRGLFRLSGDVEKLVELRLRIDRGHYSLKGVINEGSPSSSAIRQSDALTVGSLLRLFLRELEEPLLPNMVYNASLQVASDDDVEGCVDLVRSLPTIHRRVLLYVIAVLQQFARRNVVRATSVDDAELAQIFAPAIFRCPSTEISIISTNARFEARFVQLLINHLPCDTVDLDYIPNVEQGLEGQNVKV